MSLLDKLNIKPTTTTTTKGGSLSLEKQINNVFKDACLKAIKEHPKFKKFLVDVEKTNVFKQTTKDGKKVVELETIEGEIVALPCEDVQLENGTNKETLDTAFKVGTIQTYIDGITKKYVEYIKVKK